MDRGASSPDRDLSARRRLPRLLRQRLLRRTDRRVDEDAKRRLVQAAATPINWVAVVCEWAPDFTSDERHKVNPAVMKDGAGVGLALEQAFAQR
jgi:hypothetical protein